MYPAEHAEQRPDDPAFIMATSGEVVGYLYLTDRKSYMIISGGVNIYPQETENLLIPTPR